MDLMDALREAEAAKARRGDGEQDADALAVVIESLLGLPEETIGTRSGNRIELTAEQAHRLIARVEL